MEGKGGGNMFIHKGIEIRELAMNWNREHFTEFLYFINERETELKCLARGRVWREWKKLKELKVRNLLS